MFRALKKCVAVFPGLLGGTVRKTLELQSGLSLLVGFGGIEAVNTEFPYRVPIVDRGAIAVPLFADPISDS